MAAEKEHFVSYMYICFSLNSKSNIFKQKLGSLASAEVNIYLLVDSKTSNNGTQHSISMGSNVLPRCVGILRISKVLTWLFLGLYKAFSILLCS